MHMPKIDITKHLLIDSENHTAALALLITIISEFFLKEVHSHSTITFSINPLTHMPILGYSNSVAKKDMMSKILTNGDTIF